RFHDPLQVEETHMTIKTEVPHLLVEPENVSIVRQPVRPAFEPLPFGYHSVDVIVHESLSDIQILGSSDQPQILGRDNQVVDRICVDMGFARVPASLREVREATQPYGYASRLVRLQVLLAARRGIFKTFYDFDLCISGRRPKQTFSFRIEVWFARERLPI